ncbi:response regulator [Thermosynechococcaceae cyanobacterium BACA0444]|uniref:Response regulator n=1 Tax=Pseudocalidococcus azoricus BACA0444 TaxID=2918990 RepID=A0AAE4JXZ1_9CYAN|nr:response regulator [Pseudocalidococcus azoricus]MDS3860429.1 response regulator [Pseudocalidococcus azoricus BACA0444]
MTHTTLPSSNTAPPKPTAKGNPMVFPAKVLQKITASHLSGRFTFFDPNDKSVIWQLYVGNGQLHYANSKMGQPERIAYVLQQIGVRLPANFTENQTDYQWLCQLWKVGTVNLTQLRKLIFLLSQEALVHLLALPQAEVEFDRVLGLENLILSVPIRQAILPMRSEISQWAQLRTIISSPFQRVTITNPNKLQQCLWEHSTNLTLFKGLTTHLTPGVSIYSLATKLKLSTFDTATILKSLIAEGGIDVGPFVKPKQEQRPVVACIDDSKTVQRNVRLILETSGYQVMGLTEPARAITALARQKPNLVLMDITMPEVDGYELCRMLRQSDLLKDVPIVMLTGRDGLIDRIRARMVGATDYLTKPFTPQELLTLAERFARQARPTVA